MNQVLVWWVFLMSICSSSCGNCARIPFLGTRGSHLKVCQESSTRHEWCYLWSLEFFGKFCSGWVLNWKQAKVSESVGFKDVLHFFSLSKGLAQPFWAVPAAGQKRLRPFPVLFNVVLDFLAVWRRLCHFILWSKANRVYTEAKTWLQRWFLVSQALSRKTQDFPSWLSPDVPCPISCPALGPCRYYVMCLIVQALDLWCFGIAWRKRLNLMTLITRYG